MREPRTLGELHRQWLQRIIKDGGQLSADRATHAEVLRSAFGVSMERLQQLLQDPDRDREDVAAGIAYLQDRQPQLVALSPHDSCDWSLGAFRRAFGGAYQNLQVGEAIEV